MNTDRKGILQQRPEPDHQDYPEQELTRPRGEFFSYKEGEAWISVQAES
jgi:hypothetical protein